MPMRMVALLGALTCVLGVALTVADPAPQVAFASCEARPIEQMRDEADATAIGTIVEIGPVASRSGGQSSSDLQTYWLDVSQVFDGSVQELIQVQGPQGQGLDGAAQGRSYLLFLRGETPTFTSDACSSIPLPIQVSEAAETVAGWEWTAPEPGGAEPGGVEHPRAGIPWVAISLGGVIAAMMLLLVRDVQARRRRAAASRS
ncbi:hypothetical protein GCM10027067_07710 [Pseudactinotalea suaedae]